eukprot:CAMPEP_0174869658 /NCGR_PEP_ID=MMETSP1114-20130205/68268_1 /TAXON_ID=312471 /ORGANISM="Neobodo designis, Strain CCAP 1951/1" /LENGTH=55 /DNA_ID=CAMNT_0016104911 /DNA_START=1 /DNA_END=165 /DNA_ORIENTATION=-
MEHLTCFLPGTIALGARELDPNGARTPEEDKATHKAWMEAAAALTETCVAMYLRQ